MQRSKMVIMQIKHFLLVLYWVSNQELSQQICDVYTSLYLICIDIRRSVRLFICETMHFNTGQKFNALFSDQLARAWRLGPGIKLKEMQII